MNSQAPYRYIFPEETKDEFRKKMEISCINNNLRLESDDLIYNAYGIAVAKYLGGDETGLRFENINLETDFNKVRILR